MTIPLLELDSAWIGVRVPAGKPIIHSVFRRDTRCDSSLYNDIVVRYTARMRRWDAESIIWSV
jgi:hypothetical protein